MGICFRFSFFFCLSSGSNTCQHIIKSVNVWLAVYFSSKKLLCRQQPSDFYSMLKVRWQAEFQRSHSNRMCVCVSPLAISLMDKCSFTLVCQAIDIDNKGVELYRVSLADYNHKDR